MTRLFIIEGATGEKTPFLRGVRVESLMRVGLSFKDAHLTAQSVRDRFDNASEITVETGADEVPCPAAGSSQQENTWQAPLMPISDAITGHFHANA